MFWKLQKRKLSTDNAVDVCERILSGESSVSVAGMYGISPEYARKLANGSDRKAETAEVRERFKVQGE